LSVSFFKPLRNPPAVAKKEVRLGVLQHGGGFTRSGFSSGAGFAFPRMQSISRSAFRKSRRFGERVERDEPLLVAAGKGNRSSLTIL
jgi:hypothetical protein